MYDPDEPPLIDAPAMLPHDDDRRPVRFKGTAAHVELLSWGTDRSPAYTLRVVRLVDGRMTCGRTFTAASFLELRLEAVNHGGRDGAVMADIENCLTLAGQQLEVPGEGDANL